MSVTVRRLERILVPAALLIAAALAITSLLGDSITFDETSHLGAGMSNLKTGDFRLAPDHPPLAKLWCAWPLLFSGAQWPSPELPEWLRRDPYGVGRAWLFHSGNDGERLMLVGRLMMVLLLVATLVGTWAAARVLFGPVAALLTLGLAALCPTMLAHGRLVTTDMPVTLCGLLALWTFARLMERVTPLRLAAGAAAVAALALVKFSWVLVAAAMGVVLVASILRGPSAAVGRYGAGRTLWRHGLARIGACAVMGLTTWTAIWSCYLWRYSMFADETAAQRPSTSAAILGDVPPISPRYSMEAEWERLLTDPTPGSPAAKAAPLVRWARGARILPEAYLFGFTYTLCTAHQRDAYLLGETSTSGWRRYFPIVFLIKTPLATLVLLIAGLAALVGRRARCGDRLLMMGLAAFVLIYGCTSITARLNIGHRHLLPLYPILYILAGVASAWLTSRAGMLLVGGCVAWLAAANAGIHPHYLSYFNELIGGPADAHLFVVDSNIDWGQDLKRLAAYSRARGNEPIKLAYFGSADPTAYAFPVESLVSFLDFGTRAELTAGTYVLSVTQRSGVYEVEARDAFWGPKARYAYAELHRLAHAAPAEGESADGRAMRENATREWRELRYGWLLFRLRRVAPHERIGWSLMVYRLSEEDLKALLAPVEEPGAP